MGADQQLGIVVFAQLSCDGPRKLFGGQRELRVDAGLVATWVLSVPTALQVEAHQSRHWSASTRPRAAVMASASQPWMTTSRSSRDAAARALRSTPRNRRAQSATP